MELTHQSCGGHRGRIFQIGFQITRNERIALIKGCFDDNAGVTLYTEHYIHGRAIKRKYMFVHISNSSRKMC